MIKSVIWASMVDYPGQVCTSIFFDKCNFACEYCHNKDIKNVSKQIDFNKEILPKLLERKSFVKHIILSGGECTIAPEIENIMQILCDNGFKVGIHTNGSTPEFLKKNISKISFIGMDIKNDLNSCNETVSCKFDINKLLESIDVVLNSNIEYEFRTTVYPKHLDEENCVNIAKFLNKIGAKQLVLQQYNKIEGIDVIPYSADKLEDITAKCNEYINTKLRGISYINK